MLAGTGMKERFFPLLLGAALCFLPGPPAFAQCTPDAYEENDACIPSDAVIYGGDTQSHNFCQDAEDWINFNACTGRSYTIDANPTGVQTDVALELFDKDCAGLLTSGYGGPGLPASINWTAPADGTYHIRAYQFDAKSGNNRDYDLTLTGDTSPCPPWIRTYGGGGEEEGHDVIITNDGGFLLAAHTESFGAQGDNMWIVKLDEGGQVEWEKTQGADYTDVASRALQESDGSYLIAGRGDPADTGWSDLWLMKLDASGSLLWQNTYGTTGSEYAPQLIQASDSGLLMAFSNSFSGSNDFTLIKTDALGNLLWQKYYTGLSSDWINDLIETSDNGFLLTGNTYSYGAGSTDLWIIKADSAGTIQWQKTLGESNWDYGYGVIQTSDGNYAISGAVYGLGAGWTDAWLIKLDTSGNVLWQKTYGDTNYDYAHDLTEASNGDLLVCGTTASFGAGGYDAWVFRLTSTGTLIWGKTYGGSLRDQANEIKELGNGQIVVTGYTESFGVGDRDVWVLKLDSSGDVGAGCVLSSDFASLDSDSVAVPADSTATTEDFTAIEIGSVLVPSDSSGYVVEQCPADTCTIFVNDPVLQLVDGQLCGGFIATPNSSFDIEWTNEANNLGYLWEIYDGAGCTGTLLVSGFSPPDTPTASVSRGPGHYYWQVKALGDGIEYCDSNWVCNCDFYRCTQLPLPSQTSVEGDSCSAAITLTETTPILAWSDVANESGYEWEVWDSLDCTGALIDSGSTASDITSAEIPTPLASGTYSWRVRAIGDGAVYCNGNWQCGCIFSICTTLSPPTLAQVDFQACGGPITTSDNTPILEWSDVTGESGYVWEIWDSAGCTGLLVAGGITGSDEAYVTVSPFLPDGVYSWRVKALGNGTSTCDSVWTCGCQFTVSSSCSPDVFEPDDSCHGSRQVILGSAVQNRNFCDGTDDWVRFNACSGSPFTIETSNLGLAADTVLELYDSDCDTLLSSDDNGGTGLGSLINWVAPADGVYHIRVFQADSSSGPDRNYDLSLTGNTDPCRLWSRTYGGGNTDSLFSADSTSDGGYVLAGNTTSFGEGNYDYLVIKLDYDGDVEWQKTFGDSYSNSATWIRQVQDGGYIVAGNSYSTFTGSTDVQLFRLDSSGLILWQRSYGSSVNETTPHLIEIRDGGFLITTRSFSGNYDALVIRLNAEGSVVWEKLYGEGNSDYGYQAAQTVDGGFVILGEKNFSYTWLFKIDSAGNLLWDNTIGPTQSDGEALHATADGGVVVTGTRSSDDLWAFKVDASGVIEWNKGYSGVGWGYDYGHSIAPSFDGGYIIAGESNSFSSTDDILAVKLDSGGNLVWDKVYTSLGYNDYAKAVLPLPDGGYLIAGVAYFYGVGGADFWVIKTDSSGNTDATCSFTLAPASTLTDGTEIVTPQASSEQTSALWFLDTSLLDAASSATTVELCPADICGVNVDAPAQINLEFLKSRRHRSPPGRRDHRLAVDRHWHLYMAHTGLG
jgi:uncharacterized delta-60 repeat protein